MIGFGIMTCQYRGMNSEKQDEKYDEGKDTYTYTGSTTLLVYNIFPKDDDQFYGMIQV